MDINRFLEELDRLFEEKNINDVEPFLRISMDKATEEEDKSAQFTILNEMMGFYRDTSEYDKSIKACQQCIGLMKEMNIEGTVDYATALQNIANAHRAAGLLEESLNYYMETFAIYEENIEPGDYRFASLNNNIALLYQEMGNYEKAAQHLKKALAIIEKIPGAEIEVATTLSNLGASLLEIEEIQEAEECLNKALEIFKKDTVKNFHYSAALSAMAAVKCKKEDYAGAIKLYEEALPEIEINMGQGSAYEITKDNLEKAKEAYEKQQAEKTEKLQENPEEIKQEEYDKLPTTYMGITRINTLMAQGRVGVQLIGDFYEKYTGFRQSPEKVEDWIDIDDYKLATVTNGEVFRDDLGIFTDIRNHFMMQPEKARLVKLAREISAMAQTGQVNYGRSMGRKDYVTATLCIGQFMEHTMKCLYILNKKYAPYYKWLFKGIEKLPILPELAIMINDLARLPDQREMWNEYQYNNTSVNENDQKAVVIEQIARLIINELKSQKIIVSVNSNFLNDYVSLIMEKANYNRGELIDEIIHLEFEAFDKVQNVGGRAECQNNWPYFYLMRKSQYLTWTDDMLLCIRDLWLENKQKGWNMITEKYGRMMESTSPEEYKELAKYFPEKSDKTRAIVAQIAEIQVQWMEDFAKEYPKLASQARNITSETDSVYDTSYETYLKGELLTYSDTLLKMYAEFIIDLYNRNENLAKLTIENTAKLQGYDSLKKAEESLN